MERSNYSQKARGLSHLQLFIWPRVLCNICSIYEWKAAHHSWKGKLLLLPSGHTSWNCEKWRVVTGSRKIISEKGYHALASLTPQRLYIRMSPLMCCEMNPLIRSRSNDRCLFITHGGIFALAVAFCFPLRLSFGTITASWKWIYTGRSSIMILFNVAEGTTEGAYKVVWVIGCVFEREGLFCACHVLSSVFKILAVCLLRVENRMDVMAGWWDIYTQVPAISGFNLFGWLTNTKRPSRHLAEPQGTTWMRSLETRCSTRGHGSIGRWVMFWHLVALVPLRPRASRRKLNSSLLVPTVQPSTTATNAYEWKQHTQLMS